MVESFSAAQQWQVDLNGSMLIEASAGTGKTYTIGNLYLRHILDGRSPAEILVVSFTNAATDELKLRIRKRLSQAIQLFEGMKPDDDFLHHLQLKISQSDPEMVEAIRLRLQLALRNMDEAAIFTIHGFCQVALNEFALKGNHHFEQNITANDAPLWDNALKDWWRARCYPMPADHWHLLNMSDIDLPSMAEALKELRRHRSQHFVPEHVPGLEDIFARWESTATDLQNLAKDWQIERETIREALLNSKAISQSQKSKLSRKRLPDLIDNLDDYFQMAAPLMIPDILWALSTLGVDTDTMTSKIGKDESLKQPFFESVESVRVSVEALQRNVRRRLILDAMDYCSERVSLQKNRSNLVSFDDQIDNLLVALRSVDGDKLAEQLAQRFPIAMIDEFQDTDSAQYELFQRIYQSTDKTSLGLIGDPKQAIYGFRGADIFTYIGVSQSTQIRHYSLTTNWRSDPDLITAINEVFAYRDASFVFDDAIGFYPALAANRERNDLLLIDGQHSKPLNIWQLPVDEKSKSFSNAKLQAQINQAICDEIIKLLSHGEINGNPVKSNDIAVLVRSTWQGEELREVMIENGLSAISIGRDSIFSSEEAGQLLPLLEAIATPTNESVSRKALASGLLALSITDLSGRLLDDVQWQGWTASLISLNEKWSAHGFGAMFAELIHQQRVALSVCSQVLAERKLTNLLHLGELLTNQSKITPGSEALLAWLARQIEQPDHDEAELRLETDQALIKIVTIHKSKGLEYPIVFLPYAWDGRYTDRDQQLLRFHDAEGNAVIDLDSEQRETHWLLADRERLAEDLRLLYVGLTRARSKVYTIFGHAAGRSTQAAASALAWLLLARQSPASLTTETFKAYDSVDELNDRLAEFISHQSQIELNPLPQATGSVTPAADNRQTDFPQGLRTFKRHFSLAWRINSFSGLTRDIHQATHVARPAPVSDPIFNFQAGSHVGLLLHALLENLDFTGDINRQSSDLIQSIAPSFGIRPSEHGNLLSYWLEQIINTPINETGNQLSQISNQQRLNELDFDFPVQRFDTNRVNELIQSHAELPLTKLTGADFTGLMTGSIDLVFEIDGRYFIADYKSNLLGLTMDDYGPVALSEAMAERRYDLQLLIYSIALHRYLKQRLPDYRYENHFGGCFYLFLRGMRIETGYQFGSYFNRPDLQLIEGLDQLLGNEQTT